MDNLVIFDLYDKMSLLIIQILAFYQTKCEMLSNTYLEISNVVLVSHQFALKY